MFEIGQGSHPSGAILYQKVEIFDIFWAAFPLPCSDCGEILHWQADPRAPRPCLTWICATSRPCGAKNLIFGLWVKLIPAVCRFAASCR